jgi:carbonic anhydrase
MDPRSNPNEFWGISESNPVMGVLRNAGGRVTEDVLRSLRVAGGIMGYGKNSVGSVAVVHHVDCGMTHFHDEKIGQLLAEHAKLDGERAKEAEKLYYGEITE